MFDINLVFFYFGGMASLLVISYTRGWYIKWKKKQEELKEKKIRAEKDGWIKATVISGEHYWDNNASLRSWRKKIATDLEVEEWIRENIKGGFHTSYIFGNKYIKFDNDEDGVAFKLRWL